MPSALTPAELRERQRTDHLLVGALDAHPCPIRATGHRTPEDVRADRNPVPVGDLNPPAHYRVVYDFDTLRGPGQRHRPTVVHVASNSSGAYPAKPPSAWVISGVVPWTPHFTANQPICLGSYAWIPNRTQLVDLFVHVGKLLNFDEPPPAPGYHGWNPEAIAHWRNKMALQPLHPSLKFPVINPEDVLRVGAFAPAAPVSPPNADRFHPARTSAPATDRFRGTTGREESGRFTRVGRS